MAPSYDLFEVLPDGTVVHFDTVPDAEEVWRRLTNHANQSPNECFALEGETRRLIAQFNVPVARPQEVKRVFQIAYTGDLAIGRAELLKHRGYEVITKAGNQAARAALLTKREYDLFIVGHAAPENTRKELVDWLKTNYPKVPILALNWPRQQLSGADFNATEEGTEKWLSAVIHALG